MGNPAEQAASDAAAITDGQPGLEQFDEAEQDDIWEVFISGWNSRDAAESAALIIQTPLHRAQHLVIGVRKVEG